MLPADKDPSVFDEPQFRKGGAALDPSEAKAHETLANDQLLQTAGERVEHSVWDEPAYSGRLAGEPPAQALTYASWLGTQQDATSSATTWLVVLVVAALSGPWAILGTFLGALGALASPLMVVVLGPLMEEVMKIAVALWVVEKRPFLFQSRWQIALCAVASGLFFAAVENVLYLHVYVPDPSAGLIHWRWTVCVGLHAGCTLVASLGLMRIWSRAMHQRTRPQVSLGAPLFVTAITIHGVYNACALAWGLLSF